jgi:uncharacterized protein (TIGR01440 family)
VVKNYNLENEMVDITMGADLEVDDKLKEELVSSAERLINELFEKIDLKSDSILVIGCSSSEILGNNIGKGSSYAAAKLVFDVFYPIIKEKGIFLAAQCCEHLNRALIVERKCAEKYGYDPVAVIPQPKAGGSFATVTYRNMADPVAVEHIKAHAGIDIGDTLIGMHLRDVAVPIRLSVSSLGNANIVCAYTRPKYIGGARAIYS